MSDWKSQTKRFFSPFYRPFWRRIWIRIESRISTTDARVAACEQSLAHSNARLAAYQHRLDLSDARLAACEHRFDLSDARLAAYEHRINQSDARLATMDVAWRQHVPAFLNAVGTVSAFGHELVAVETAMASDLAAVKVAVSGDIDALKAAIAMDNVARSAAISRDIDTITEQVGAVQRSVLEQAVPVTIRLDNGDASIRALWERIEFVRREILFEMAHGGGQASVRRTPPDEGSAKEPAPTSGRVLSNDKVSAARAAGQLRLNLGCGHIALPEYVNVDVRDLPGVDIVSDVAAIPLEPGCVDEIFSAHLLEHFPQEALRRRLLPHWFSLLRPGGTLRAVTPDAQAMLAAAGRGDYPFEDFREVVFGAQDYVGDYHYNLFTPDSLRGLLEEAGFTDVVVLEAGRRNGKCFEFDISAKRP